MNYSGQNPEASCVPSNLPFVAILVSTIFAANLAQADGAGGGSAGASCKPEVVESPIEQLNIPNLEPPVVIGGQVTTNCTVCGTGEGDPDLEPSSEDDNSAIAQSTDPNQKIGPSGAGVGRHILPGSALSYRVDFENEPSATAPAQQVTITDQLSTNLDLSTFQLTDLGFGDQMVFVPPNLQHFETNVVLTCCGDPFEVQIEVGINLASREFYASFRSIVPSTSLPPPVSIGFLPPEDGSGRGQGHVSYLVSAKTNLISGTQIRNVAIISFDNQTEIATDQIDPHNPAAGIDPNKQAFNTIDAGNPSSSVVALPNQSGRTFRVSCAGTDEAGGSGIGRFDIYASTNSGPFSLWRTIKPGQDSPFVGVLGNNYAFYSIARDLVGHEEIKLPNAESQTTVVTDSPVLSPLADKLTDVTSVLSVTNTAQGAIVGSFLYSLGPDTPRGVRVNSTNGILRWLPTCDQGSTTNTIIVRVTDSARTNISDEATFSVIVSECVELRAGQMVLRAGDSGWLPVELVSTVPLTNLSMTLSALGERLTNSAFYPWPSEVCTNSFTVFTNGIYELTFGTCATPLNVGTQFLASIYVTAFSNQSSAFVPIEIGDLEAMLSTGSPAGDPRGHPGRVVVVGEETLLESVMATNGQVQIYVYSPGNTTNLLETTTSIHPQGTWQPLIQTTTSELFLSLPLQPTNNALFIRGLRQ